MRDVFPTIDVIVAFHRNDRFLQEAIKSIFDSKDVSVNLILIDDRQKDDASKIENFQDCVVHKTEGNVGFPRAANLAKAYLTSEYVGLCGSDDLVTPTRFKKQIERLSQSNADLCLGLIAKIDEYGKHIRESSNRINLEENWKDLLLLTSHGADATWTARRDWWNKNVKFEDGPLHDWELGLKLSTGTRVTCVNEVIYFYRMSKSQTSRTHSVNQANTKGFVSRWCELNSFFRMPSLSSQDIVFLTNPSFDNFFSNTKHIEEWLSCALSKWKNNSKMKSILFTKMILVLIFSRGQIKLPKEALGREFFLQILRILKDYLLGRLRTSRNIQLLKK